jgi:branched-chain amino acid transport system ATP-binding protein
MTNLLEVDNVTLAYGHITAVREASLTLGTDELVVVLGANGAGKSTLMSAIIGWMKPKTGAIFFDGQDITRLEPWKRARKGMALVPEGGHLFTEMTVAENIEIMKPTKKGLELAFELFPVLKERTDQVSRTLSGGERQMLALARAISTEPKLLIVDEASTGLMPLLVEQLLKILSDLSNQGLPVLLVEQNTKSLSIAKRGYVMEAGHIVKAGTSEQLTNDPEVRRAYLGL